MLTSFTIKYDVFYDFYGFRLLDSIKMPPQGRSGFHIVDILDLNDATKTQNADGSALNPGQTHGMF